MHLQTHSITASKCIAKLAPIRPPSSHDHDLQVHLQTRSITASKLVQSWPPSAYLQTRLITASNCISNLTQSRPPSVSPNSLDYGLQVLTILASKCFSKLAQSQSWSASLSLLDQGLQVHLLSRSITASECISEFTRSSLSGVPQIALKYCPQSVQIYCV